MFFARMKYTSESGKPFTEVHCVLVTCAVTHVTHAIYSLRKLLKNNDMQKPIAEISALERASDETQVEVLLLRSSVEPVLGHSDNW
jgi:uncharacterized protein Yka (UPF0111/DUF47 family)